MIVVINSIYTSSSNTLSVFDNLVIKWGHILKNCIFICIG